MNGTPILEKLVIEGTVFVTGRPIRTEGIRDANIYGYEVFGDAGISAEYYRCYAGEWGVCYKRNGAGLYTGRGYAFTGTFAQARAEARRFAVEGTIDGLPHTTWGTCNEPEDSEVNR